MRHILLALLLGLAAVAASPTRESKIVGGSITNIQRWPMAVSVLSSLSGFRQMCGASILNNRSVLSAAHCFPITAASMYRVRVGSTYSNSGGTVFNAQTIINHPNFDRRTLDRDVMVMRIAGTFAFGNNVRAGAIAGANYNLGDNQVVWAIGWGATSFGGPASPQLREVQIWTVNQATCRQRYAARATITDNMLCSGWLGVGGRDQCQGDSGGPLLHNNIVVGVCSFGHECARPNYPGVNARVSRFAAWITSNA